MSHSHNIPYISNFLNIPFDSFALLPKFSRCRLINTSRFLSTKLSAHLPSKLFSIFKNFQKFISYRFFYHLLRRTLYSAVIRVIITFYGFSNAIFQLKLFFFTTASLTDLIALSILLFLPCDSTLTFL
jgi:hypothetical protein